MLFAECLPFKNQANIYMLNKLQDNWNINKQEALFYEVLECTELYLMDEE